MPKRKMKANSSSSGKKSLTGNRNFVCTSCEQSFKAGELLKRHIGSIHTMMRYTCKLCQKAVSSNFALKLHMKQTHGDGTNLVRDAAAYCGECKKEIGADFKHKHLMEKHRELYSRIKQTKSNEEKSRIRKGRPMTVKIIKTSTAANFCKDFFLNGKTDCQSIVDLNFYTPPLLSFR